jgi:hypothetical protein
MESRHVSTPESYREPQATHGRNAVARGSREAKLQSSSTGCEFNRSMQYPPILRKKPSSNHGDGYDLSNDLPNGFTSDAVNSGSLMRIGRINHVCGHLGNYVCLIRDERNKP